MYDVDIQYRGEERVILNDASTANHMYRIAQEAVNNALKHANAISIEVVLSSEEDYVTVVSRITGVDFRTLKIKAMALGCGP